MYWLKYVPAQECLDAKFQVLQKMIAIWREDLIFFGGPNLSIGMPSACTLAPRGGMDLSSGT